MTVPRLSARDRLPAPSRTWSGSGTDFAVLHGNMRVGCDRGALRGEVPYLEDQVRQVRRTYVSAPPAVGEQMYARVELRPVYELASDEMPGAAHEVPHPGCPQVPRMRCDGGVVEPAVRLVDIRQSGHSSFRGCLHQAGRP